MKKEIKNEELKQAQFTQTVLKKSGIKIVKLIASWSGKCQIALPLFMELSRQYQSEIDFYTMDIDKSKTIVNTYTVNELPHILFFKDGELVDQVIGTVPRSLLESKIKDILKSNHL